MNNLVVAALFLVVTHLGIPSTRLREQLVASIGEGAYRALYSAVALVGMVWLVMAWLAAPFVPVWDVGPGLRHLPLLVMPVALLLAVCALTQPNPTAVGQETDADTAEPAHGIIRVTRHPLMWAIGLWAIAHMLANGDQAALIFFGSMLALALGGALAIDARRSRTNPPGWGIFLQRTSVLPFAAILEGRQRLAPSEIGLARVAMALGIYVLLIWLHPLLFGVSVL